MIRSFIFVATLVLGSAALAETTTLTTCSSSVGDTIVAGTIGVSSEPVDGVLVRNLMASTLSFGGVPATATELNCVRNQYCAHIGDQEVLKISYRLYPHFKRNSGELRSITMVTESSVMRDTLELTKCEVVNQYPQYP